MRRCQRFHFLSLCYCRLLGLLYKAPLVSISPFERLPQNLTPLEVKNLISRLSLLIANLYQFVLVPALIFIIKTFSSPLVFTLQWSVYRETSHSSPSLCFARQNKLISFSFPSSTTLSVPYSSSQPRSAPAPVRVHCSDRTVHSVLGTLLHLGFKPPYL